MPDRHVNPVLIEDARRYVLAEVDKEFGFEHRYRWFWRRIAGLPETLSRFRKNAQPRRDFRLTEKSGHFIQWEQPELVIQAIRDVSRTHASPTITESGFIFPFSFVLAAALVHYVKRL